MISNTFPYGSYRKSEDADMMDKRQQQSISRKRKISHVIAACSIYFNGKIKNSRGQVQNEPGPCIFQE